MKIHTTKIRFLAYSFLLLTTLVSTASADAVSEMNRVANQTSGANVPPRAATQTTRIVAMTQIAIHDALNAIDPRYEPSASPVAAIAAAAFNVLRFENPTTIATLTAEYNALLATVPDGPAKTAGIAIGEASASAIRAERANDGSGAACPAYVPGTLPGDWRPTPAGFLAFSTPCWGAVTPFAMKSGDRFRPPSRPYFKLDNALYTRDFLEVKEYGGATSTSRTTDQSEAARFWYTGPVFLTWGRIAGMIGTQRGFDLWESGRMYALLGTSQADSLISIWDAKRYYAFWRPVTAIREADTDDNPETEQDATWSSYMVTPNYPDNSSGHSSIDASSAEILIRVFETDEANFSLATTLPPNPPLTRSFTSFSGAALDGAESRIWGGIHFRQACIDGLQQGSAVARQVFNHHFRPLDETGGK
jgi:hypothetical protein